MVDWWVDHLADPTVAWLVELMEKMMVELKVASKVVTTVLQRVVR